MVSTDRPDTAVPRSLQVAAAWSWRLIVVAILATGVGWVLVRFSEVTIPLAVAVLLAAMLSPVARQLIRWGLPRAAATAITVLGGLALISGALTLIGSQILGEGLQLSTTAVGGLNQLLDWLSNGPLHLNTSSWLDSTAWTERITEFLRESSGEITTYAAEIGTQIGHFFAGLIITIFALIYFLYDGRGIFTFLLERLPGPARGVLDAAALQGWRSLSGFVRATILVAATDGLGIFIVALAIGVPVAPALGALVFIGAFVPLIGAFVSGSVSVLVTLVMLGWVKALIMLAGLILIVQVEGHILQPLLMGRAVKMHPLAVLLAIAIGILAGGVVGALLAVPTLAFAKAFVQHLSGQTTPPELPRPRWTTRRMPLLP